MDIKIELEFRVVLESESSALSRILSVLRKAGMELKGHISYRLSGRGILLLIVSEPAGAAVELKKVGAEVETETVVVLEGAHRRGMLSRLLSTLEAEGIQVGYSWSACTEGRFVAVFRTDDNLRAEDVLKNYLIASEPNLHSRDPDTSSERS